MTSPLSDWRGRRGREGSTLQSTLVLETGSGPGTSALLREVEQRANASAASMFTPVFPLEVTGSSGPGPDERGISGQFWKANGTPQSSLHGLGSPGLGALGLYNTAWCDSFEQAIDTLGEALTRAKAAGLTSANVAQAQAVYDDETSYLPWKRTPVGLSNCEAQTARIALLIQAVNSELAGQAVTIPPSVIGQLNDANYAAKPPEPMSATTKLLIGGGIAVVGVVAVAVIVGQVAPLLKRVVR